MPGMTAHQPSRRAALSALGATTLAIGGALSAPARAQAAPGHDPVPPDLLPGGALDELVEQAAAADGYSGTMLLLHDGHPVLSRTFGMANKARSIPNQPNTIFSLGSVTKIFTDLEWFPDDGYVYIDLCNYEGGSSTPIDIEARRLIVQ
jgi:CubicO group peptidase (beta-lactamase class C family)